MRGPEIEGFGGDVLQGFLLFGGAGEPGFYEDFGGGGCFDDFGSAREATG